MIIVLLFVFSFFWVVMYFRDGFDNESLGRNFFVYFCLQFRFFNYKLFKYLLQYDRVVL